MLLKGLWRTSSAETSKFPKEQFIAMDEYTAAVKFELKSVNVCVGTLSDFGERLSRIFSDTNRRGGKHCLSRFSSVTLLIYSFLGLDRTRLSPPFQFIRFCISAAVPAKTYLNFCGICLAPVLMCMLLYAFSPPLAVF